MGEALMILTAPEQRGRVLALGAAVAGLLGARTGVLDLAELADADREAAVLDRVDREDVDVGVISGGRDDGLMWSVLTGTATPLLVVPAAAGETGGEPAGDTGGGTVPGISHILVPLDGAEETARAVAAFLQRLRGRPRLTATHVIDPQTVPSYWDQAAHAHDTWLPEFLLRHVPAGARLQVHRGTATDLVQAEAEAHGADLILLAWKQELAPDRAALVRSTLTGTVPVLLIPVPRGPSTAYGGPSALPDGTGADQDSRP